MKYLFILIMIPGLFIPVLGQRSFEERLDKFDNNTAIMFYRQDIDEMPLWSRNNDYLGCNIQGDWVVFDLQKARFKKTKLSDYKVGILLNLGIITHVPDSIADIMKASTNYGIRSVVLPDSTSAQIQSDLFNSQLLINEDLVMTLRGNCHSLSATLDGRYLAFISELDGLIVMKLGGKD